MRSMVEGAEPALRLKILALVMCRGAEGVLAAAPSTVNGGG